MSATLLVTIDTEEEFDWNAPVHPDNNTVEHAAHLPQLQELFEDVGVRPTYVVDYPIATSALSVDVLGEFQERGVCEIGAHLHPWVNPPIKEEILPRHSYLSNLPLPLQQEKLDVLTAAIEESFGSRPTTFKAGRYGIDFRLIPHLQALGYTVDTSILATMDWTWDEGPDFTQFGNAPFLLEPPLVLPTGDPPMLEVPCTVGFTRRGFSFWSKLHRTLSSDALHVFHPIGIMWHLGIIRKNVLSPEGTQVEDQIRLLKVLGHKTDVVLNVTLHSPSIQPGNTPFVRTEQDLKTFLDRLRATLTYAVETLQAQPMTFREYAASYQKAVTA